MMRIAVLGSGSWGTALAIHLCRNERHAVSLLGWRTAEGAAAASAARENAKYLPGVPLPPRLTVEHLTPASLSAAAPDMVVLAVPSSYLREVLQGIAASIPPAALIVCAVKGIEQQGDDTFLTMNAVIASVLPPAHHSRIVALGGPSFAREVAAGLPTAVVLASASQAAAAAAAACFHGGLFRAYTSSDVAGVEHGAALKNVIAIACGISDGAGLGANSRAALITRGLGEITQIACARGAQALTLLGLAGMGDLVLTCTSVQSRNYRVGLGLGAGRPLQDILQELGQVAEGVATAKTGWLLARHLGIEAPLMGHVFSMLHEGRGIREVLAAIAATDVQPEWRCELGGPAGGAGSQGAASTPH
jgi:glycerol-3-phosphate dehydrogenase (NAD(P)+)